MAIKRRYHRHSFICQIADPRSTLMWPLPALFPTSIHMLAFRCVRNNIRHSPTCCTEPSKQTSSEQPHTSPQ